MVTAVRSARQAADDAWALAPTDSQQALLLAEQALELAAAQDDPSARARALRVRGRCLQQLGRPDQAAAVLQEAAAAAAATGQPQVQVECLNGLAHVYSQLSDVASCVEVLQEALTVAEQVPGPLAVAGVLANLSGARIDLGDPVGAAEQARALLELGVPEPRLLICAHGNLGRALHALGDHEEAVTQNSVAVEMAQEIGDDMLVMLASTSLAEPLRALGRIDEAVTWARRAVALSERLGAPYDEVEIRWGLGLALTAQGDDEAALAELRSCVQVADRIGSARVQAQAQQAIAAVLDRLGEHAQAYAALRLAWDGLERATREETTARAQAAMIRHQAAAVAAEAERLTRENATLAHARRTAEELLQVDALTRVASRRRGTEELARHLALAPDRLGVLVVDVDHFKAVNDAHGHAAGDRVLVEIAARLREAARDGDLVARWGGEEFLVLLPDLPGARSLSEAAERLRAAVAASPIPTGDGERRVTVSIGGCLAGALEDPLEAADQALYAAKQGGRDRVSTIG